MKILQIHNEYRHFGGESAVLNDEYSLLKKIGYEVDQFIVNSSEIDSYNVFKKIRLIFSVFFSIKYYRKVRKIIQQKKPDVVHIHNVFPLLSPSVYYAVKKEKIKVVQTVHNYRFICSNGLFYINNKICEKCKSGKYFNAFKYSCYRDSKSQSFVFASVLKLHSLLKTFYKKIDVYLPVSEFVKLKLIENGYNQEKIVVKHNYIETIENVDMKKQKYFLYFGRLTKEKGLDDIILLAEKNPHIHFKIMGKGDLEDDIRSKGFKNIELLGFVDGQDKNKIIQQSIATIVPSKWYETFGLVVLESFFNQTIVLTSGMGGLGELVEHEKNGFIYQTFEQLNTYVNLLLNNEPLVKKLSNYAYLNAKNNFNIKNQIDIYNSVYR